MRPTSFSSGGFAITKDERGSLRLTHSRAKAVRRAILLTLFLTATLAVPVWVILVKKYGKAETYRVAMAFYACVLCGMPFAGPGIGKGIYFIAFVIGFAYAAALVIPWAIVPDVVEYDELKTGNRREGLFYGGTTFTYKAATGIAFLLSSMVLQLAGYEANVAQSNTAINAIKFLIGPAPAMFLVAGAVLAMRYPLTREKHSRIVAELAAKKK